MIQHGTATAVVVLGRGDRAWPVRSWLTSDEAVRSGPRRTQREGARSPIAGMGAPPRRERQALAGQRIRVILIIVLLFFE